MGDTAISWTDKTWNPLTGCTRVSAGCDHCYAFQLHDTRHVAWKRGRMPNAAPQYHQPFSRVQLFPERLTQPLHWRKPARIFVNSMSDLFHEAVADEFITQVFAVMALAPQHTFQVLTKRPERMAALLNLEAWRAVVWATRENIGRLNWVDWDSSIEPGWPLPNVWLGTSVENQDAADERVPWLMRTPAVVRFLSCEPLLGPVNVMRYVTHCRAGNDGECFWNYCPQLVEGEPERSHRHCPLDDGEADDYELPPRIDWVICGGESGPHARPLHPDWVRSLRDQCVAAGIPLYFKQVGGRTPKAGGRELDGRTWDEYPDAMKS